MPDSVIQPSIRGLLTWIYLTVLLEGGVVAQATFERHHGVLAGEVLGLDDVGREPVDVRVQRLVVALSDVHSPLDRE